MMTKNEGIQPTQQRRQKEIIRVRRKLLETARLQSKFSLSDCIKWDSASPGKYAYLSNGAHGSNLFLLFDETQDDQIVNYSLLDGTIDTANLFPYDVTEMTYSPVERDKATRIIDTTFFTSLREANIERQFLWENGNNLKFPQKFRLLELQGEIGEACNVLKKMVRESLGAPGSRATKEDLCNELADVLICLDLAFGDACVGAAETVDITDDYDAMLALASEKLTPAQKVCVIEQFFDGLGENAQAWVSRKFNDTSIKMGFDVFLAI